MKSSNPGDLSGFSMSDLFRLELETQTDVLVQGLLTLERDGSSPQGLESMMRAAHSIKGAARIVTREFIVKISHSMEDCFVIWQKISLQIQG